jgi:cyclophilin family peptidyl-prolyl cis-trans isomerase
MSVLLELGEAGDIVIDLLTDYAPRTCENFLKLCVTHLKPCVSWSAPPAALRVLRLAYKFFPSLTIRSEN